MVDLGKRAEVNVGAARGLQCDDLSIVRADIDAGDAGNHVTFVGLRVGSTLCRAGTHPGLPSRVFRITVREEP